jgi:hypothetical protein
VALVAEGLPLAANQAAALRTFIRLKDVTSVVVDPSAAYMWAGALDRIAAPQPLGGVILYQVAGGAPSCAGA